MSAYIFRFIPLIFSVGQDLRDISRKLTHAVTHVHQSDEPQAKLGRVYDRNNLAESSSDCRWKIESVCTGGV